MTMASGERSPCGGDRCGSPASSRLLPRASPPRQARPQRALASPGGDPTGMVTGNGHRSNGGPSSRLSPVAWLYGAVVVSATVAVLVQALGSDFDTDGAGTRSGFT